VLGYYALQECRVRICRYDANIATCGLSQSTRKGDTIRSSVKHDCQTKPRKLIGEELNPGDSRGESIYLLLGICLQEIEYGGKSGRQ